MAVRSAFPRCIHFNALQRRRGVHSGWYGVSAIAAMDNNKVVVEKDSTKLLSDRASAATGDAMRRLLENRRVLGGRLAVFSCRVHIRNGVRVAHTR